MTDDTIQSVDFNQLVGKIIKQTGFTGEKIFLVIEYNKSKFYKCYSFKDKEYMTVFFSRYEACYLLLYKKYNGIRFTIEILE